MLKKALAFITLKLSNIRSSVIKYICSDSISKLYDMSLKLDNYYNQLQSSKQSISRLEELLANTNASDVIATSITISQHAIHRARTRLKYSGSDDDIRKRLYKSVIRNLNTLDHFEDGEYDLDRNARCRIKDNTVVTVVPRRGSK